MKHLKLSLYLIFPILSICIVYFSTAFIKLEINPANMSESTRFITLWFGFMLAAASVFLAWEINMKK